jgi:hypothetical protein
MARPTLLTDEVQALLAGSVRAGLTGQLAAEVAGIGHRTFQRWMVGGQPEHRRLREAVHGAQAACQADSVARMTLAANRGHWRAAAWLLERQYPEGWARSPSL